jgi:hypothetical protein
MKRKLSGSAYNSGWPWVLYAVLARSTCSHFSGMTDPKETRSTWNAATPCILSLHPTLDIYGHCSHGCARTQSGYSQQAQTRNIRQPCIRGRAQASKQASASVIPDISIQEVARLNLGRVSNYSDESVPVSWLSPWDWLTLSWIIPYQYENALVLLFAVIISLNSILQGCDFRS